MPHALLDPASRRRFRAHLLRWFDREKRDLPWRGESDPYRILVSEIMLQQTRVAVVKERYTRFLKRFPSISRLAQASEESVLAEWSGLGYYRRARALHAAVRQLHRKRAFPGSAAELAELPGIGRYTAAAVASITFGEPVAVVDGNVKRVLQRLAGKNLSDNACWQEAEEMLARNRPGDFNQAMMELGATVCLPGQPLCQRCPVTKFCASPLVSGKNPPVERRAFDRRRKGALSYLLAQKNGAILLQQRPATLSLMPGMWELPQPEAHQIQGKDPALKLRHSITTTDYTVSVFTGASCKTCAGSWVHSRNVNGLPLTGLARKILRRFDLLH
jgi:A/G-specific adenine glycosylase